MIKTITLLGLTLITSFSFSQNYTIAPSNTLDEEAVLNTYLTSTINITHNDLTTDSVEIYWEVVENTMLSGWDYSWCAYLDCFGQNITSGTFDKFGPGQNAFFKVNLNPMSINGGGFVKIRVFDTNTPGIVDTLTYNYNAVLGLSDGLEYADNITVYPNPTSGKELSIEGMEPNSKINIFNSNGQLVHNETAKLTETSLHLTNLEDGIYFLKLSKDGAVYSTRKLIVK